MLNKEQQEAVDTIEGQLLMVACPGSGKTTTMIHRIANMVNHGINPENILMVTFTKAAAEEMEKRYLKMDGAKKGVSFATIHSLCLRIIRETGMKYEVMSEADQWEYFEDRLKNNRQIGDMENFIRDLILDISRSKSNPDKEVPLQSTSKRHYFNQLFDEYEAYKVERHLIDYDDMVILARDILRKNPVVLNKYQEKFQYIQVDEAQDTDVIQRDVLYLLAGPNGNLAMVGDEDQCLTEDTMVITTDGEKEIGAITCDDMLAVASGHGTISYAPFEDTWKKRYTGDVVIIKTKSGKSIKATPNHILFCNYGENKNFARTSASNYQQGANLVMFGAEELVGNVCLHTLSYNTTNSEVAEELEECFNVNSVAQEINGLTYYCGDADSLDYDKLFECAEEIAGRGINSNYFECSAVLVDEPMPFYFMQAADIRKGHFLAVYEGNQIVPDEVISVAVEQYDGYVYDINVATYRNYIANGIVSHNCIYAFRGASPSIMLNFPKDYPNAKVIKMGTNYRSSPNIVEKAGVLIKENKERFDKEFVAAKKDIGTITQKSFKNKRKEVEYVTERVKQMLDDGVNPDEIAILYRNNSEAEDFAYSFVSNNIGFKVAGSLTNKFEGFIWKDILNYWKVANGQGSRIIVERVLAKPNRYLKIPKFNTLELNEDGCMTLSDENEEAFRQEIYNDPKIDEKEDWMIYNSEKAVAKFFELMRTLSGIKTPAAFMMKLRPTYEKHLINYAKFRQLEVEELEEQYEDFISEAQAHGNDWEALFEYVKFYNSKLNEMKKSQTGVTLSTMHKAKGLEWDRVFVVDCVKGVCPAVPRNGIGSIEEERRLFYVATTRARKELILLNYEEDRRKLMRESEFLTAFKDPAKDASARVRRIYY